MCAWMLRRGLILLLGAFLAGVGGCGHNPNHDINMEKAREAANRVHTPPKPGEKMLPGSGG